MPTVSINSKLSSILITEEVTNYRSKLACNTLQFLAYRVYIYSLEMDEMYILAVTLCKLRN